MKKKRVLLIEDSLDIANWFERYAKRILHFDVVDTAHTTDGAEFLLGCQEYEFIISDLSLPGKRDIVEVLQDNVMREVRLVFVSALDSDKIDAAVQACLSVGWKRVKWTQKPITLDKLGALINDH